MIPLIGTCRESRMAALSRLSRAKLSASTIWRTPHPSVDSLHVGGRGRTRTYRMGSPQQIYNLRRFQLRVTLPYDPRAYWLSGIHGNPSGSVAPVSVTYILPLPTIVSITHAIPYISLLPFTRFRQRRVFHAYQNNLFCLGEIIWK